MTFKKLVLIGIFILLYTINKSLLLFVLPGILIFYSDVSKNFSVMENIIHAIFLSLASVICGFWLLRYIPLSFTLYLHLMWLITITCILLKRDVKINTVSKEKDWLLASFSSLLLVSFGLIYYVTHAPAGADMATYSYYAKAIEFRNGFPESLEPFVPIEKFGSQSFGGSTIGAAISLLTGLEVYRSMLVVTFLAYVLVAVALVTFLNRYFSTPVGILTTLFVLFISRDLSIYIAWGGNTTVLAIAFMISSLTFTISGLKRKGSIYGVLIPQVLLFYASFTVHHIPLISAAYWLIPCLLALYLFQKDHFRKWMIWLLPLLFIFSIPYLTTVDFPNETTLHEIKKWQTGLSYNKGWNDLFSNPISNVPYYLEQRVGSPLFLISLFGILTSFILKTKHGSFFLAGLFSFFVQIANSQYWSLPLSAVLYPDRVASLSLIPISFFAATFFSLLIKLYSEIRDRSSKNLISLLVVCIIYIYLGPKIGPGYREYLDSSRLYSSVTQNDINAFNWIKTNTPKDSVFGNNYGDAGIWIPAIAERKVVVNDSGMENLDELVQLQVNKILNTSYLYIGDKSVYKEAIEFTESKANADPKYIRVYSSGGAVVYKIDK